LSERMGFYVNRQGDGIEDRTNLPKCGTHRSLKLKEKRGQKRLKSLCSQVLKNKESPELRHKRTQKE